MVPFYIFLLQNYFKNYPGNFEKNVILMTNLCQLMNIVLRYLCVMRDTFDIGDAA